MAALCAVVWSAPVQAQSSEGAAAEGASASGEAALDRAKVLAVEMREKGSAEKRGVLPRQAAGPESPSLAISAVKGLLLCLGVFLIGTWLVKGFGGKGVIAGSRKMRIIERLPVAARTALLLIEVEGRKVLVAVGPDRVSFDPAGRGAAEGFDQELSEVCTDAPQSTSV